MAANPILAQMGQTAAAIPGLDNVRNLLTMMRGAANPNALVQGLLQNTPQYRQAMDLVRQNGGDAKTAFYNLAQQKGIEPNEILNLFR